MKQARTTPRELLERLVPVERLDDEALRVYRSLRSADERTVREGLVWLLDRLCDMGLVRRTAVRKDGGRTVATYRDLRSLDTITIGIPDGPTGRGSRDEGAAARSGRDTSESEMREGPAAPETPEGQAESPPDLDGMGPEPGRGAEALPAEFLEAVAASSRRVDLAGALNYLYDLLKETVGYDHLAIFMSRGLVTSSVGTLSELDDVFRWPPGERLTPEFLKGRIEETGRAVSVPDLATDRRLRRYLPSDARGSLVAAPLEAEGYVYGVLEVWTEAAGAYSANDTATIDFVARFAGGLIKRRLEVEELIFVDQTSQIHNRRYFDEQLVREMERCKRTGQAMALLMTDLDDFKSVNDQLGHAAGDSVLRQVARILAENARQVDIVARYGGEEFAVILPGVSRESARAVAERIRRTVAEQRFITGNEREPTRRITVSVGGALYPLDAKSRADLMDKADRIALYAAKRQGKNRVVFWDEAVGQEGTP